MERAIISWEAVGEGEGAVFHADDGDPHVRHTSQIWTITKCIPSNTF